jgi:hypothetical protein
MIKNNRRASTTKQVYCKNNILYPIVYKINATDLYGYQAVWKLIRYQILNKAKNDQDPV